MVLMRLKFLNPKTHIRTLGGPPAPRSPLGAGRHPKVLQESSYFCPLSTKLMDGDPLGHKALEETCVQENSIY